MPQFASLPIVFCVPTSLFLDQRSLNSKISLSVGQPLLGLYVNSKARTSRCGVIVYS